MKRLLYLIILLIFLNFQTSTFGQNVGIGTNTPSAALDVIRNSANGTAWFRGTDYTSHFNYSTNENTLIRAGKANGNVVLNDIPGGKVGVGTNTPSATLDVIRGSGLDGTAIFRGTQHTSNFNYYINEDTYIRGGKDNSNVILNDIPGGKVGIGTASPGFPLSFPNTIGDKISLWGSSGAHYGFGIQGFLLQIHTAAASDDIAFGYGSSSSFTETMRIKGTGALSINGNTGTAGQVLKSNGNSAPTWSNPLNELFNNLYTHNQTGGFIDVSGGAFDIPGLVNIPVTITSPSRLIVSVSGLLYSLPCALCGFSWGFIQAGIYPEGSTDVIQYFGGAASPPNNGEVRVTNGMDFSGTLNAGNYYFKVKIHHVAGPALRVHQTTLKYIIVRQ